MKKIKVAIAGCGKVAREGHMPCYELIGNAEVVAAYDIVPKRLKAFCSRYKIEKAYTNFQELLEREEVDLIDICTPGFTHYQLGMDAIKHQFNVLIEKPPALSLDEVQRLYNEVKRKKVKLCVVCNYRFLNPIVKAMELYKEGKIGRIRKVASILHRRSVFSSPSWIWNEKKSGGILYELAFHVIDMQTYFCGKHEKIVGFHKIFNEELNYTTDIYAIIRYENGGIGLLDLSYFSSSPYLAFNIFGTVTDIYTKPGTRYFSLRTGSPVFVPITEFIDESKRFFRRARALLTERNKRKVRYHFVLISRYINSLIENNAIPIPLESVMDTMKLLEDLKNFTWRSEKNETAKV